LGSYFERSPLRGSKAIAVDGLKVVTEKKERIHTRMKIPLPINFILNLLPFAKDFGVVANFF
jgi:hypothetical protein